MAGWGAAPADGAADVRDPYGPSDRLRGPGWPGPHTVFIRVNDVHRPQPLDRARLSEHGLTPRQSEVALLLAEGQSNQCIASRLGISLGTVKKHCQQVFCALEVDNRAAAAAALVQMIG